VIANTIVDGEFFGGGTGTHTGDDAVTVQMRALSG
jgi:hypothetical protein